MCWKHSGTITDTVRACSNKLRRKQSGNGKGKQKKVCNNEKVNTVYTKEERIKLYMLSGIRPNDGEDLYLHVTSTGTKGNFQSSVKEYFKTESIIPVNTQ